MKQKAQKSGHFVLRVKPDLHAALSTLAHEHQSSLNQICNQLIVRGMGQPQNYLDPQVLDELKNKYAHQGLLGMILFGSVARQTSTESSDLDLMLVMSDETPIRRSLYRDWDHEKIALHFSHLPDYSKPLSSLWLEIGLDGIILSDVGQQMSKNMIQLKKAISSGLYSRKEAHGHPYWIKKEVENEK